jgi:hypothetical protein
MIRQCGTDLQPPGPGCKPPLARRLALRRAFVERKMPACQPWMSRDSPYDEDETTDHLKPPGLRKTCKRTGFTGLSRFFSLFLRLYSLCRISSPSRCRFFSSASGRRWRLSPSSSTSLARRPAADYLRFSGGPPSRCVRLVDGSDHRRRTWRCALPRWRK